ncbi:hypothetical protein D3C71_584480 [compost metagenome]
MTSMEETLINSGQVKFLFIHPYQKKGGDPEHLEGKPHFDNSMKGGRENVSLCILHSSRHAAILAHSPN